MCRQTLILLVRNLEVIYKARKPNNVYMVQNVVPFKNFHLCYFIQILKTAILAFLGNCLDSICNSSDDLKVLVAHLKQQWWNEYSRSRMKL